MPFLLISPKIVPKIQLIKKGGCFEYHAVIADKIEYRYIHRASICPASGMDRRSFFMPKTMGKYKRLEVFYLSKPVYAADKPSDCHYCYFWTNGRKGCRLGRDNCYYLISLPPKPKSECDGCPYGRDHPCIGCQGSYRAGASAAWQYAKDGRRNQRPGQTGGSSPPGCGLASV